MNAFYALVHKDDDSAFGVSFPDLPAVFSAVDEEDDIVANAMEALGLYAADTRLPVPSSVQTLMARDDVRAQIAEGAFLVRVPFIEDDARVIRVNISMEAGMLRALDAAAERRGLTRSAFLASCARHEIERIG
jgi:predicted RNase H-like HicB family nuclease